MPPKSLLWQLFYSDGNHYQTDQSHKNATCHGCLSDKIDSLKEADRQAIAAGMLATARNNEELHAEGQIWTLQDLK